MSYEKAMKHWRNPRKHKLTPTRKRGNQLVFGGPAYDAVASEKEVQLENQPPTR